MGQACASSCGRKQSPQSATTARRPRFLRRISRFRLLGPWVYSSHDCSLDACSHQQTQSNSGEKEQTMNSAEDATRCCSRPPRRLPAAEEEPDDEDIVATALSWATVAEVRRQDVTRWAQQVRSTCRREAWDNVKLGRELSDPRSFNRRKIHRHCCLSIWIADRSIKTITQVAWMALNVELRTPRRPTLHFNHEMNVRRRTSRIRDRFDGSKIILAG